MRRARPYATECHATEARSRFAAQAAGAKKTTSTRGSASRRCVTERAQEATPASAPPGVPTKSQISLDGLAPGRLGREDARNFRCGSPLDQAPFPSLTNLVERQPELAFELDRVSAGETEQRDLDVVTARE